MLAGMNLLPFEPQPPYRPRAFVPGKIDLGDWNQVVPLFDKLEAAAAQEWPDAGAVGLSHEGQGL
jgi:hypothetical protein